ncbi:TIM barrel protein [Bacillus inaquosorum]|uniref:sugar phosphate isomerase/epimerase family protein n=1 Tax=Bacillus inaquosorum TaxID=483913 RepID=UPI0002E329B0|nr:TIM barrel protein [Bacillus inaquosorum]MED4648744.1 TIM barrel protein [Bacillus inaquosorum]MED4791195.1 TIM barrel protein [Bacillus inaquosorum]
MMSHIRTIAERAWKRYGVRAVIHPHAGGYIEFEDEIQQLLKDIPYDIAGLCLDTGHLYYSKMDPEQWLRECADRKALQGGGHPVFEAWLNLYSRLL